MHGLDSEGKATSSRIPEEIDQLELSPHVHVVCIVTTSLTTLNTEVLISGKEAWASKVTARLSKDFQSTISLSLVTAEDLFLSFSLLFRIELTYSVHTEYAALQVFSPWRHEID